MAPNNALGNPTAAKMRAAAEGRPSKSPARRRSSTDVRKASADGFGAGEKTGVLDRSEVTSRGTGTATRTPLEEFEAKCAAKLLTNLASRWRCSRVRSASNAPSRPRIPPPLPPLLLPPLGRADE